MARCLIFQFQIRNPAPRCSTPRAAYLRHRLVNDSTALGPRTTTSGKGFRENIIGSGTDDAVDALDRRVEFKIEACG